MRSTWPEPLCHFISLYFTAALLTIRAASSAQAARNCHLPPVNLLGPACCAFRSHAPPPHTGISPLSHLRSLLCPHFSIGTPPRPSLSSRHDAHKTPRLSSTSASFSWNRFLTTLSPTLSRSSLFSLALLHSLYFYIHISATPHLSCSKRLQRNFRNFLHGFFGSAGASWNTSNPPIGGRVFTSNSLVSNFASWNWGNAKPTCAACLFTYSLSSIGFKILYLISKSYSRDSR